MSRGRPPLGKELVEALDAPPEVKRRAKVVLETLTGQLTVDEACEALEVKPARFHEIRREALEGLLQALLPKPLGRPRAAAQAGPREAELQAELEELKWQLEATRVRLEIAQVMPHLLRTPKEPKKGAPAPPTREPGTGGVGSRGRSKGGFRRERKHRRTRARGSGTS